MDKIKLGIVDDHFHTRQSLKELLSFNTGFELGFVCESGKQFLTKLRELPEDQIPDIVLMDVDMPELDGIDTIAIAKTAYPSIRFLILTVYDDEDILFRAIKAGASGFLLKDEKMNVIEQHINNLYKGIDAPMSPSIARKALSLIQKSNMKEDQRDDAAPQIPFEVTIREIEVLQLLVDGFNYRDIGEKLFISPFTVRKHVSNIYNKLHVDNRVQVINVAQKNKWV